MFGASILSEFNTVNEFDGIRQPQKGLTILFKTAPGAIADIPTEGLEQLPSPRKMHNKTALTETFLKNVKPSDKLQKFTDGMGLYVVVLPSGVKTFRYDYRLTGSDGVAKRETLTIGRFEPGTASRMEDELKNLDYGLAVSLKDARALRDRASRLVEVGESPSRVKADQRAVAAEAPTFGSWVQKYFDFKSVPKSGDECLADSTLDLRKSVYRRLLEQPLGKLRLEVIKPMALAELLDKAKAERGPGPAVHARELVLLVYRFAIGKGVEVANPAESIQRRTIATFKPHERNLKRWEVKVFIDALQTTQTPSCQTS